MAAMNDKLLPHEIPNMVGVVLLGMGMVLTNGVRSIVILR